MSDVVNVVVPPSGSSAGVGYIPPGSDVQLTASDVSATASNVATLLNAYSPSATQSFIDTVNTSAGQVHVPALDSDDIKKAVSLGVGAAVTAKTLLVAAGASATVPGIGWVVAGAALIAAGAFTAVHMARAVRIARSLNSGYVLYIDQGDYSVIEDALLNGIEAYRRAANPWVPVGLVGVDGVSIQGGPCRGKSFRGLSFHFYPPGLHPGQHRVDCYDANGVRFFKPFAPYGAVASSVPGVALTDLVRVGAHACLLTVWGKRVPVYYIDLFARYVVKTWQAREYVSRKFGELLRASRSEPTPPGYLSFADINHNPRGINGLSTTGWADLWIASNAAAHAAALQFGVLGVEEYWNDSNPINSALLSSIYFSYSYALYAGVPWDTLYSYLTGSIQSIPSFVLSAPSRPTRPPRPIGPVDSSGGVVVPPVSSGDSVVSSRPGANILPFYALPILAIGLFLLRKKRR